jgi:formate-dependent nitrite reductase membrane component NrfD
MSTNPQERPTPEHSDWARENRLHEIRREAERKGYVDADTLPIAGAPFPMASPDTGYYGVPLLKEPQWSWEIPPYFFVGGAAGSAAVIGAIAHWTGRDRRLARDCRLIAAGGAIVSSALLISDLGRPQRFLAMLRVFKPQSPMSMGAWTLAAFGSFAGAAAFAQIAAERFGLPVRMVGNIAEAFSAAAGLPFSNYTGVLIGATAIPLWNEHVGSLPIHFGMSGLNSAVGILELMGHKNPALNTLGIGAAAIESMEGVNIEMSKKAAVEPLKRGTSGFITRLGGVLSGPVPLALRIVAAMSGTRRSTRLRKAAAISSVAGSVLTRFAWVYAGHVSARDWRLPLEIERQKKDLPLSARTGSMVNKMVKEA